MNDENLSKALGVFIEAMRLYAVSMIQKYHPNDPWEGEFFSALTPEKQQMWLQAQKSGTSPVQRIDYHNLSFLGTKFKDDMYLELNKDNNNVQQFVSKVKELNALRNKINHYTTITPDERESAFVAMKSIANMLDMPELRDEVARLQGLNAAPNPVNVAPPVAQPQQPEAPSAPLDDDAPVLPWYRNCLPHFDIRSGNLDESVFAANLNEVAMSVGGPEAYTDAATFFAKTYVTQGMRDITSRVVRALNGEATENRVISLQTGFGGGKTHTLISLYHIVRSGAKSLEMSSCRGLLLPGVEPHFSDARVAVFTNNTNDVLQGREVDDGLTLHTLWGEIAYQLGGREAYEKVRSNDEQRIAPTSTVLKPILEVAGTSLILIDELADYCVKAHAVSVGQSNLFLQTNSFLQTLTETVSQVPKCVLIATLPASVTELGTEQIANEILSSLHQRIVRIGANVQPVSDDEIYEVIRHRLFENIYNEKAEKVISAYKQEYSRKKTDFPEYASQSDYVKRLRKSYPFHPELIEMFHQRWGGNPRFQRTRGVLRILASIVQDLWKRRNSLPGVQLLIHTSDVYLENLDTLTGTFTNLQGSNWESVMSADVRGSASTAYILDEQSQVTRDNRITQGFATTVLLASVSSGSVRRGLTLRQINLCMVRPKAFNLTEISAAIGRMEEKAHYLHSSHEGEASFWFDTKANINNLITQAKDNITVAAVNKYILCRLQKIAPTVADVNILVAPSPDNIPEQPRLTMVILPPDMTIGDEPTGTTRETIMTIATKRGNNERVTRNTIFYLACSSAGISRLREVTKEVLSRDKVLNDTSNNLDYEQRRQISKDKDDKSRETDEALVRAYCVIVKYEALQGLNTLVLKEFMPNLTMQVKSNVLNKLREAELLLDTIGQQTLRDNNLFPTVDNAVRVKDIYTAFLNNADKPMITGPQAVVNTVNKYCYEAAFKVGLRAEDGTYGTIYDAGYVPDLNVESENYWLLDKSVTKKQDEKAPEAPGKEDNSTPNKPSADPTPRPKRYKRVTVKGSIPIENYAQLFTSFVQTLRNNDLKIEISFTAKSTTEHPLEANSLTVSSVRESASQLGLEFDAEED